MQGWMGAYVGAPHEMRMLRRAAAFSDDDMPTSFSEQSLNTKEMIVNRNDDDERSNRLREAETENKQRLDDEQIGRNVPKYTKAQSQGILKQTVPRICQFCGGRRIIRGPGGLRPCPACISWQQRPDYVAGKKLMSENDFDLGLLVYEYGDKSHIKRQSSNYSGLNSQKDSGKTSEASRKENSSKAGKQQMPSKKSRRSPKMTEERRLAIKAAMQNRGPLSPDHKRKISDALTAKHRNNPDLAKRPKRCSHCGKEGHNRRTCPDLVGSSSKKSEPSELRATSNGSPYKKNPKFKNDEKDKMNEPKMNKKNKIIVVEEQRDPYVKDTSELPTAENLEIGSVESYQFEALQKDSMGTSTSTVKQEMLIADQQVFLEDKKKSLDTAKKFGSSSQVPSSATERRKSGGGLPSFPNLIVPVRGGDFSVGPDGAVIFPLPRSPDECVSQASLAVIRAWLDGIRRQSLEVLLPEANNASDNGWPGGIRQQFRAALPMVEGLLLKLKKSNGLEGRITAEWLDEGDCVGAWQSEKLAAVLFPTADTLEAVRRIDDALSGRRLILVINPQWQPQGNVVSDFGFGSSRRSAERFIGSLEEVYCLRRVRVLGDEVRILRSYPGQWQVYYVRNPGDTELISVTEKKPTYENLLRMLKDVRDSRSGQSWIDRVFSSSLWNEVAPYEEAGNQQMEGDSSNYIAREPENTVQDSSSPYWGNIAADGIERDIVTGEIVEPALTSTSVAKTDDLDDEGEGPNETGATDQ